MATAVSTVQIITQDADMVNLTNTDAINTTSFSSAGNWDSGQLPMAGNDYVVGPAYTIRTPIDNQAYAFAGDSLTVAGTFSFKQTNVITVADLRLTNGVVENFFAGGNPDTGRLAGNITVLTNATFDAGGNSGAITGDRFRRSSTGKTFVSVVNLITSSVPPT